MRLCALLQSRASGPCLLASLLSCLQPVGSRCPLAAAPEVRCGQVVGCGRAPAVFRSCQRSARFTPAGRSLRPALLAGLASRCAVLAASSLFRTLVVFVLRCGGCRGIPQPARSGRFTRAGRSPRPAPRAGLPLGVRCWLLPARLAPSRCAFHAAAAARAPFSLRAAACVSVFYRTLVRQPVGCGYAPLARRLCGAGL